MRLTIEDWKRWQGWIERIKEDLGFLINDHAVFEEFRQLLVANEEWIDKNNGLLFCDFVARCYAARAAIGLRRHLKARDDDASLMKLLQQMQLCSSQLTYEFYLSQYPLGVEPFKWQKPTFALLSTDGKVVSAEIIANDIQTTKAINAEIEIFADRTLAHLDKRTYKGGFTWDDLTKSIDNYNKLACRYIAFLVGSGYSTLEATIQFDWKDVFHHPLIKPA